MDQEDDDFTFFCMREHPRLVGSLTLYCGRIDVAEELAQEALARACLGWPRVRLMSSPGAWVHRVAMNLANSWFRRLSVERRARQRQHQRDAPEDTDTAERMAVRAAISRLPRRQRMAVVLRYYLDLPVAETAAEMQCAEGTVKALTFKGLAGLRSQLEEREGASHVADRS